MIFVILFHLFFSTAPQEVNIMSFNVRYGTANDGENSWENRKSFAYSVMKNENYDFIGVQEALHFQIQAINAELVNHNVFFRGRGWSPLTDEACGIFYSNAWEIIFNESGTFWLSENPEKPASKSWDSSFHRIVTWAKFRNKTSDNFVYVYNTHFDHLGQTARENSSKIIIDHISKREHDAPVILLGDFNASEKNKAITILKKGIPEGLSFFDPWNQMYPDATQRGTFNYWKDKKDGPKIDYIFALKGTRVLDAKILRQTFDGKNPSDHYPVTARLVLTASLGDF